MQDHTESREEPASIPFHERFSRQYPAIMHAGVVSAFVVPLALLPYLVVRRQINRLRQTITHLERKTSVLQRALDLTADSNNITMEEVKRLQDLALNSMEVAASLRKDIVQQKADRRRTDETINTDLRRLLAQSQHLRPTIATLQELGTSLADVAAFMQEVELDLGMNPTSREGRRGIDRLRLLALRMQSIQSEPVNDPDYKDDVQ